MDYSVIERERPTGTVEYVVVPAGTLPERPDPYMTYFDRDLAKFHATVASGLPAGYFIRLDNRPQHGRPAGVWLVTGNVDGDQRGTRIEWPVGQQPPASSTYRTAAEAILGRVAGEYMHSVRRAAQQRYETEQAARQAQPVDPSTGTRLYVWYNPDEVGRCSDCGSEYGPWDMVQDTPAGTICENCCR